jgi:nicotinamide-nucleotide amidase
MLAISQSSFELAASLGEHCQSTNHVLAGAESCTGGWVSAVITSVAGSSAWFDRGFVTYSNEAKVTMLGVSEATLAAHGAVSEATASEMARGALANSSATLAFSVTGVAGPTGGTPAKPVGTVCFAFATKGNTRVTTQHFAGDRSAVRAQSVEFVLTQLKRMMEQ